jgi:hypothetical protein
MFSDEIHALEQENNAPVSCYRDGWHDMIVAKQQIGFFKEGRLKNEKNNLTDLVSYFDIHIHYRFR